VSEEDVSSRDVDELYEALSRDAEAGGYHLNPDAGFTRGLVRSLIVNERRYGYRACPCRLASGERRDDLDIICPCDYRDPDLGDYGACYCALYVSSAVRNGEKQAGSIPERRPAAEQRAASRSAGAGKLSGPSMPIWRCRVCGYLCAREQPPDVCPICKAMKERFELFLEAAD